MTRRIFMSKMIRNIQWALLSALLPGSVGRTHAAQAKGPEASLSERAKGLSLEQIAREKLHHGRRQFLSPFSDDARAGLSQVLKWKLFSKNAYSHLYSQQTVQPVSIDWKPVFAHRGVAVTFVSHACVLIKDVDQYLLIDPVLFGISRWIDDFSPLAPSMDRFPTPDQILITHGHYDHLDKRSLKFFGKSPNIVTPLGYDEVIRPINPQHTTLDWFQSVAYPNGRITLLPCHHWTMRNPLVGPNRSLWGAYLIETAGGVTIFISGDTAYTPCFQEIGAAYDIDLAILNVGAYEPRWMMRHSHMNPAETIQAARDLGAAKIMPVHWGTFRLGDEPVFLPPQQIRQTLRRTGAPARLVDIGHGQTHYMEG